MIPLPVSSEASMGGGIYFYPNTFVCMNRLHYLWSGFVHTMPAVLILRFLVAMLIYTLSRGVFYVYNADILNFSSASEVLEAFWGGLRFDLSALLYINGLVILLHLLPFRFVYHRTYQRVLIWAYWLFNIPPFLFNQADTVYYRFSQGRTTLSIFSEFANENTWSFLRFLVDYWQLSILTIVIQVLWLWSFKYIGQGQDTMRSKWLFYPAGLGAMLVGIILSIGGIRGGFSATTRPIAPNHASLYISRPEQRALVLNTPFCMIRLADKEEFPEFKFMPEDEVNRYFSAVKKSKESSPHYGLFKGRNVVIIIWESLAREWVGSLNKDIPGYKGFTPFIDSLLSHSYYFERAYAVGGKSIDAMPGIFASIPKPIIPFVSSPYSGHVLNSIVSLTQPEGYSSRFYHNAPNGSMGFDAMARQLGFPSYRGMNEFNNNDEFDGSWGIWDEPFLQYMAHDLSSLREPFIASEFTTTSHQPFVIPEKYQKRFPEGLHPMHRCIRYTDFALEQFFETAQTQAWYQNTVFVITADHSVGGYLPEYKNTVGSFAIPIIIFDPRGALKGREANKVVQQTDLLPTLITLLGLKSEFVSFGHDMFDEDEPHFAVQTIGHVFQMIERQYALQFDGTRVVGLYDLEADRSMRHDIQKKSPELVSSMLPKLKAYMQELSNRMRGNHLSITQGR